MEVQCSPDAVYQLYTRRRLAIQLLVNSHYHCHYDVAHSPNFGMNPAARKQGW